MSSMATSLLVFVCVFAGALLGMALRCALPAGHLSTDSKDTMKLGMGLIGTMAALVLGLMVSSAKSAYDAQKNEVTEMSAKLMLLDRGLAHYGPGAKPARHLLRSAVEQVFHELWPEERRVGADAAPIAGESEALYDTIQQLAPKSEAQRSLQTKALELATEFSHMRWLLFEQTESSISMPFLVVLVFWLTILFMSFGLFAPVNATVIMTLLLCALSVSGAIFLILELDRPFDGSIRISSEPVRKVLDNLGK